MKKLLLFAAIFFTHVAVNFAQWTNTNYYTSDIGNNGVFQIIEKDNILFAATSQGIFKSYDMGEYWKGGSTGLPESSFGKIEKYKNSLIALSTFSASKGFYISSNNGTDWQYRLTNIKEPITLIEAKKDTLFAGTEKGIYYSTDMGNVWTKSISNGIINDLNLVGDFEFVGNNIFVATTQGLLKSVDGGVNFIKVAKSIYCTKLFYYMGTLYIANNLRLMVTSNFGATLSTIPSTTYPQNRNGSLFNDELFIENDTMFYNVTGIFTYGDPQGLYISIDKGKTWQKKWENPLNVAGAVSFYKSKNTWFQGTIFGGIYKSTNQGGNWKLSSNGIVSQTTVPSTFCNLLVPNPFDTRYQTKSLDDGNTWSLLSTPGKELSIYGCYFNKYYGFSSDKGIQISSDGKTWINSGNGLPFISSFSTIRGYEIESNIIYVNTTKAGYYKSVDEGKSYTFAFNPPKGSSNSNANSQTSILGEKLFTMAIDSIDLPYFTYNVTSGDTTWRKRTATFDECGNFNTSRNGGQSWNKPTGLPSEFMRTTITKNGSQILISGYALVSELTNRVFNEFTTLYTTEIIKKPIFKIYNSNDFGLTFKEVKLQGIRAGNQQYSSSINITNDFCAISSNVAYDKIIQQLYSLDKGLNWKDSETISPKLKISNILKYKTINYLTSDSLGLWESSDNGITWKRNTIINADNNLGIKELNGILFCHHNKGLYYLKDNQWNSVRIGELPSTIYQIGASSTSLFVTTFRDGIWKYPMSDILATNQETEESAITKVYPNPSSEVINIDFGQVGSYNIKLLTYTGTELQSYNTSNSNYTTLSVKGLPQGLYFLKIESEGKVNYQKLMVEQ